MDRITSSNQSITEHFAVSIVYTSRKFRLVGEIISDVLSLLPNPHVIDAPRGRIRSSLPSATRLTKADSSEVDLTDAFVPVECTLCVVTPFRRCVAHAVYGE